MGLSKIIRLTVRVISIVMMVLLVGTLILNGVIYWLQDSMIYETDRIKPGTLTAKPTNYEDVVFTTAEGYSYNCWFLKRQNHETKPTIYYILGNGSYIEASVKAIEGLSTNLDANVFSCSMRGSGTYEGKPTEQLLYSDAQMYVNYLKAQNIKHLFIHGKSMGGAVAIEMAHKNPNVFTGLVVENTFLSMKDMARERYAFLFFFLFKYDLIIRTKMQNDLKIQEIMIPTLFTISLKDTVISPRQTQTLYDLSRSPHKSIYVSIEGTHSDVKKNDEKEYYDTYKNFISSSIKLAEEQNPVKASTEA